MVKFLDKLIIIPGCKYEYNGKSFSSIDNAISYARKKDRELSIKSITIINNQASGVMPNYYDLKNSKVIEYMTPYAKERFLYFFNNMDELCFEAFDLSDSNKGSYITFSFCYQNMYEKFDMSEFLNKKCISTIFPYTFVPRDTYGAIKNMDDLYDGKDFCILFTCGYYAKSRNGEIECESYGHNYFSIPPSTFILQDQLANCIIMEYNIDPLTYPPIKISTKRNLRDCINIASNYLEKINWYISYYIGRIFKKNKEG